MRRSISYCEPSVALAGEDRTWKFVYTPAVSLPKGTKIKFDLASKGRAIDWQLPEPGPRKTTNTLVAQVEDGKPIIAEEIEGPDGILPQYEFELPAKVEAGKELQILLGRSKPTPGKKETGNQAQTYVERRRPFMLYVDPTGKGHYQDPEVFTIDIRGNQLHTVRILAPSYVVRNKRFDVIVRFEDEYGNLTSNALEDTLIELTYENIRENLNWKLFIPETGFIALPNLYFNEEGTYTIRLTNLNTGEVFRSAPIRCFQENDQAMYWGVLHGESERIDSTENIESCLRHFRDDKALNFFAASPFEDTDETPNDTWKLISQNISDFNEAERFVTFLGMQWSGNDKSEGVRQLIYAKDSKPILRKKDIKNGSLKKIYRTHKPGELISIPSFTMGKGLSYDFSNFDPEFERVVEIYNAWGSSECVEKEGNALPISGGKKGVSPVAEGAIRKALNDNCRFGFVAGGLDDRGVYADFYDSDQQQYQPGLTAIVADEHTRERLFQAIHDRSCYATTGERMIVGLYVTGSPMGTELSTAQKPGLAVNRHISGHVAGTADLSAVELIRNGNVLKSFDCDGYHLDFVYDDMEPLDKVALAPPTKKEMPFVYYYLRAIQEDGHTAWSSPIWVDLAPAPVKKKK